MCAHLICCFPGVKCTAHVYGRDEDYRSTLTLEMDSINIFNKKNERHDCIFRWLPRNGVIYSALPQSQHRGVTQSRFDLLFLSPLTPLLPSGRNELIIAGRCTMSTFSKHSLNVSVAPELTTADHGPERERY